MKTINEVIAVLEKAQPGALVSFDFCHCAPTSVGSWRGIYREPALGWKPMGYSSTERGQPQYPSVADLLIELKASISGRQHHSWKSGKYTFKGGMPLHVDNYGDYTETEITSIEDLTHTVALHTAKESV